MVGGEEGLSRPGSTSQGKLDDLFTIDGVGDGFPHQILTHNRILMIKAEIGKI